jgi:hypothetical protein
MRIRIATVVAALALALGASAANAETRIELSPTEGSLTGVRADSTAMTFEGGEGGIVITCEVNKRINFQRQIAKTSGALVGEARDIVFRSCRGGRVITLDTVWRLLYVGFTGSLPNIASLRLKYERISLLLEPASTGRLAGCLYRGDLEVFTSPNTTITQLVVDENVLMPFDRALTLLGCPSGSLVVRGALALRPTIRMRLV